MSSVTVDQLIKRLDELRQDLKITGSRARYVLDRPHRPSPLLTPLFPNAHRAHADARDADGGNFFPCNNGAFLTEDVFTDVSVAVKPVDADFMRRR